VSSTIGQINFLLRGIISLTIGLIILVVGVVALYGKLIETTLLPAIMGFSFPFIFIGFLLIGWHFANLKRKRQDLHHKLT
jgi:TctA family transporter